MKQSYGIENLGKMVFVIVLFFIVLFLIVLGIKSGSTFPEESNTALEKIEKTAQKQENSCDSKRFTRLLDTADTQIQSSHYKEALDLYREAYSICPMKDLEEQIAWLLGEVGVLENNETKIKRR